VSKTQYVQTANSFLIR